jgi:hypothetical protein
MDLRHYCFCLGPEAEVPVRSSSDGDRHVTLETRSGANQNVPGLTHRGTLQSLTADTQ